MKDIVIKFIPQNEQRYDTLGDYWEEKDSYQFRISKFEDWRVEATISVHELIEKFLNIYQKISDKMVDEWDFSRPADEGVRGESPECPYFDTHISALAFEMLLAKLLGLDLSLYDGILNQKRTDYKSSPGGKK